VHQVRQIAVSVHAVGERGTLPLGWSLYLPEECCDDPERRGKAKIRDQVVFQTKPQLAAMLTERASAWELPAAPILADCAYGDDSAFRTRVHTLELEYVLAVSAQISVYGPETSFAVPERKGTSGRRRSVARPDCKPEARRATAGARLGDAPLPHWLSNLPADTPAERLAPRAPALDGRARLPPAERRARPRPLRGPKLRRPTATARSSPARTPS
jgi:hypothetical protein